MTPGPQPPGPPLGAITKVRVNLVSGEPIEVQGDAEARWWNNSRRDYLAQTKFTDVTDKQDLDRLLILELQIFRITCHLASGTMYDGYELEPAQVAGLQKTLREFSEQASRLKDSMGISRKARDASAADGNFSAWLDDLKRRAKAFGIHRNTQVTRALALINEVSGVVGSFYRSDEEERVRLGFSNEAAIVEWLRDSIIPEYHEVDRNWRESEQKLWTMS